MSKDLNKCMITGYLGADPEMRYTPQGAAVTTFRVASGRSWKTADGVQHDETEWFRVVAWEKLAEICNQYLTKGTRVYVEGRLQTRKWQDKDGQDRFTTEVICSDMIILSRKPGEADDEDAAAPAEQPVRPQAPARSIPPGRGEGGARPVAQGRAGSPTRRPMPQRVETDDDIPF